MCQVTSVPSVMCLQFNRIEAEVLSVVSSQIRQVGPRFTCCWVQCRRNK